VVSPALEFAGQTPASITSLSFSLSLSQVSLEIRETAKAEQKWLRETRARRRCQNTIKAAIEGRIGARFLRAMAAQRRPPARVTLARVRVRRGASVGAPR